eukprot:TRINITY_DN568_c0_g1_i1.p1 TRINITY_DN568_c0_g1~~TRINITY_DN568_c0_g1_i1.p1  ORF type:complete len:504 (-),score=61.06 TRINITY_DN568_c0_g1_i1:2014-3525(-)
MGTIGTTGRTAGFEGAPSSSAAATFTGRSLDGVTGRGAPLARTGRLSTGSSMAIAGESAVFFLLLAFFVFLTSLSGVTGRATGAAVLPSGPARSPVERNVEKAEKVEPLDLPSADVRDPPRGVARGIGLPTIFNPSNSPEAAAIEAGGFIYKGMPVTMNSIGAPASIAAASGEFDGLKIVGKPIPRATPLGGSRTSALGRSSGSTFSAFSTFRSTGDLAGPLGRTAAPVARPVTPDNDVKKTKKAKSKKNTALSPAIAMDEPVDNRPVRASGAPRPVTPSKDRPVKVAAALLDGAPSNPAVRPVVPIVPIRKAPAGVQLAATTLPATALSGLGPERLPIGLPVQGPANFGTASRFVAAPLASAPLFASAADDSVFAAPPQNFLATKPPSASSTPRASGSRSDSRPVSGLAPTASDLVHASCCARLGPYHGGVWDADHLPFPVRGNRFLSVPVCVVSSFLWVSFFLRWCIGLRDVVRPCSLRRCRQRHACPHPDPTRDQSQDSR